MPSDPRPGERSGPDTDYSRTLRLAASSAGEDETDLEVRLVACRVLVTADPAAPAAPAALRVLIGNLRRLPVGLHLDPAGGDEHLDARLVAELEELAAGIDANRRLIIGAPQGGATVHVHVGTSAVGALAAAVADGHGTRLRPRGQAFPHLLAPGTGLGGVLTGAMLTAEAFKVLVDVLPHRRGPLRALDFCPAALGQPTSTVPSLAAVRNTTLVGGGAIGTAIALILRELGTEGTLTVVDPEVFEAPNVTTYSLGDLADAARQITKVDLIRRELGRVDVERFKGTARDYISAIDRGERGTPAVVLGAVDSVEARHEIAALHALHTLDGSTGGLAGTTLSLSEATWTGPCLRCYYPERANGNPSVPQRLAERTGLSIERLSRGDDPLTTAELAALRDLAPQDRMVLEESVGKPVCGLGRALGLLGNEDSFDPSAAFVAQQAAALVVGALIRGGTSNPANFVQYDTMVGPQADMTLPKNPRPACRCQTDRDIHNQVRGHWERMATRQ